MMQQFFNSQFFNSKQSSLLYFAEPDGLEMACGTQVQTFLSIHTNYSNMINLRTNRWRPACKT